MMRILSIVSAIASLLALVILLFGVKSITLFGTTIYAEGASTIFSIAFLVLVSLVASTLVALGLFRGTRAPAGAPASSGGSQ